MKNLLKKALIVLAVLLMMTATLSLVACAEKDGPMENAGEKLDDAIDDTGDALEDAGEEIDDAVDG